MPDDDEPGELAGPWAGRAGRRTVDGGAADAAARRPRTTVWRAADARRRRRRAAVRGRIAGENAELAGWPVVAEPQQRGVDAAARVRGGALLLGARRLAGRRTGPTACVVVGRPTLSRPVSALLADPASGRDRRRRARAGPTRAGERAVGFGFPDGPARACTVDAGWARRWRTAAARGRRGRRRRARRRAGADRRPAGPRRRRRAAVRGAAGARARRRRCATSTGWRCRAATSPCWPTAASPASTGRSRPRSARRWRTRGPAGPGVRADG